MSEKAESVYKILDDAARSWWHHRQLREQGKHEEARVLERKSILDRVLTLRKCLENGGYATNGRGGWAIHYSEWGRLEGNHPGLDQPMMRCCIRLGIPVCDSTTIPDERIFETTRLPMASTNPDREPSKGYNSFSLAPVEYVFRLYQELGATIYNLEITQ